MGNLLRHHNKRGTFGLRSKKTGKIIEKFRLRNTADFMKSKYEKLYIEELEVIEL